MDLLKSDDFYVFFKSPLLLVDGRIKTFVPVLSALLCDATRKSLCDFVPAAQPELLYALCKDFFFLGCPCTFLRNLVAHVCKLHPALVALNLGLAKQLTDGVPRVATKGLVKYQQSLVLNLMLKCV